MSRDGSKKMVFVPDFYKSKLGETKNKEKWVGADFYEFSVIAAWQPKQDSSSSSSGCTVGEAMNAKSTEALKNYFKVPPAT